MTPRQRLHHAIRNEFATSLAGYFRENPRTLADDTYASAAASSALQTMTRVLALIDEYEIKDRP